MDNLQKWLVVNFIDEGSVEIVPRKWYMASISKCFWPNNDYTGKIAEAIRKSCSPGAWDLHKVKVLGEYDDFKLAERKVNRAKITDNLSSENDVPGKRRPCPRKRLYESSSGSSSDESDQGDYPEPPKKPTRNLDLDVHQTDKVEPIQLSTKIDVQKASTSQAGIIQSNVESADAKLQTPKNSQIYESHPREHSNEFQRRVLRELYIINAKLTEHSENFDILLKGITNKSMGPSTSEPESLDVLQHFPIKDEGQLLIVENILQDKISFNGIAKYLSLFGGKETKTLTKKIMYRLLSNDIGQLYSWEGAKKKKAFKTLLIAELIIKAVRLNPPTKDATDSDIVKGIKVWLVKAKERSIKLLNQQHAEAP